MLQRRAARGSATNKSTRHVTTAKGAALSSSSALRSICPQKTSAASNARPNAVLARLVHQRLRADALEAAGSSADALDFIQASSYQRANVGWLGRSLGVLVYVNTPGKLNRAVMRTILITGGAGFIGANLVNYIAAKYP